MAQNKKNNILIVGGSSGVGLATARLALSYLPNPHIIVSSTSEEKLTKAVEELKQVKVNNDSLIDYVVGDVSKFNTQFDDVEAILKKATAKLNGKIDHVVWTAGKRPGSNSEERTNNDIIELSTPRLFGPMTFTHFAKDYITQSRHSSITITSGIAVYKPMAGRSRLTAVGGGMESGVRGLAMDLAPVRVNFVVLGAIQTPLLEEFTKVNPAILDHFVEKTLLKCIGSADEAAEAYLYSMRCGYVTGARIDVEGGALLT